eukprot:TRINITY_DN54749_c0_g1_i1.p1 TRINITY_DN54749_c0_g1~~TRINITY_DN54749_c0_g1_i1.p1  ORF type:complete len:945 (-),score=192.98 TRINITY_DN54749_c0_g1_i1:99-2849(-)
MSPGGAASLPDYYGVLEVARDADEASVKKSYRKKVLLWHPDKHPADRDEAERRIREINNAYETLSNPLKRGQYDEQLQALERLADAKTQGVRVELQAVQPRMSIPKEFMLCPMGSPDKLVRCVSKAMFAYSREESDLGFEEFFREAKFSLWWLPQQNNMCHLRSQASAAVGERGGLNVTFALKDEKAPERAEAQLSHIQEPQTFFKAVASPDYQSAFRFEAAYFPGHYLAFSPPNHVVVTSVVDDAITVLDFMLVDYASMARYKTLEEMLVPVVEGLGGHTGFVNLTAVRSDATLRSYFQNTLRKAVWDQEDFESYFAGHYDNWDFDAKRGRVRLRSKHERLAQSLRRAAGNAAEVAAAVSAAGPELASLAPDTAEYVLKVLAGPPPQDGDVSACVNHVTAQKSILTAMSGIARRAPLGRILTLSPKVTALGGEGVSKELAAQRIEASRHLGESATQSILGGDGATGCLSAADLLMLCSMPGIDWQAFGDRLVSVGTTRRIAAMTIEEVIPLLRELVASCTGAIAEAAAATVVDRLSDAPLEVALEAAEIMGSGGLCLKTLPKRLRELLQKTQGQGPAVWKPPIVAGAASAVAALGERGIEDQDIAVCASIVGDLRTKLDALPAPTLLRLTVAATKSTAVADSSFFGATALAAAATLHTWSMDDVSKLLLAATKAKRAGGGEVESADVAALFGRAAEVIVPQLPSLSPTQLIKVVLACRSSAGRPLLESAALEASRRAADIPRPQLLLLTQGLVPLGGEHRAMTKVLDFWASSVRSEPGQFGADQLAKLLQTLAPIVRFHHTYEVVAKRLSGQASSDLTSVGRASLEAAFPDGGGPDFSGKSSMLRAAGLGPSRGGGNQARESRSLSGRRRNGGALSHSRSRGRRAQSSRSRGRRRRSPSFDDARRRSRSRGRRRR